MPLAKVKHALLNYRLDGPSRAPVVVLSNSLGTDFDMWDGQMAALTAYFQVLRYDTRGHGRSVAGVGPYRLEDLGGDVVALLDLLQIRRFHVCGVSLGGMTALWLALHAKERILSVMPCNTAARIGTAASWNERIRQVNEEGLESIADATMARWFTAGFSQSHAEKVDRVRRTFCANNVSGYAWCCAALREADLRGEINAIVAPTLVISGTHDSATPAEEGKFLHAHIRGSAYLELNAAHLSNIEASERFTDTIVDFMSSIK